MKTPGSTLALLTGWSLCCCGGARDSGLDPESLVVACLRSAACGINARARVSDCVDAYRQRTVPLGLAPVLDPIYRCANRATSCGGIAGCFGAGEACDVSFTGRCDGGRAVFCDLIDDRVYSYDCGAAGLRCTLDPSNGFAADCAGGAQAVGGLRQTPSCPADGCRQTGQSCSADALDRCAGSALQSCLGGGWVEFDCGALGLGPCEPRAQGTARCGAGG